MKLLDPSVRIIAFQPDRYDSETIIPPLTFNRKTQP